MLKKSEKINKWFRKVGEAILKFRWLLIVVIIVLNVVAFIGLKRVKMESSIESWFPEGDPVQKSTEEFEEIFGNDQYAAILIEADDVFASEILKLLLDMGKELKREVPFADKITSLADFEFSRGTEEGILIENLVPNEIPTDPAEIKKIKDLAFSKDFLVNRLFSDDAKMTWLVLKLNPYPDDWQEKFKEHPMYVVGKKVLEIVHQDKYEKYNIKASGMPVSEYQERVFYGKEAGRTVAMAIIIAIVVLILFLRSVRGVVIALIIPASAIVIVYGAMGYLGIRIDPMNMTIPVYLALAVSIGYSIHLFNFFKRHFLKTGNRKEAVLYAVEHTGWPIFFTALTTVGCLLAFVFVPITPIRWIGYAAASGILVVYFIVMCFVPLFLSFGRDKEARADYSQERLIGTDKIFDRLRKWVMKNSMPITIVFAAIIGIFIFGITKMRVSMDYESSSGLKIPYVKKIFYMANTKIGSLYSYNVALEFKDEGRVKDPEVLKNFEKFISEVDKFRFTKRTNSILSILKDMNQIMHQNNPDYYSIPDNRDLVTQLLLLYEMSGGSEAEEWVDYDYTILRLMVEVNDFDAAEIEKDVNYMLDMTKKLFPDGEMKMTGSVVQFCMIQQYIVKGEIRSFLIALAIIGILMMLVFRSIKAGLIGLIPNLTPAIVVSGAMGLTGIPLDFMTMTIVPMMLGIAVDDTIHFITHVKYEFEKHGSYDKAISATFRTVGKALFMTTFILVATFSVFATSIANMYAHLGIFSMLGLSSALVADYCMTPILVKWAKPFEKEN